MKSGIRLTLILRLSAQLLLVSCLGSHLLLAADPAASHPSAPGAGVDKLILGEHWSLQSSAKVEAKGQIGLVKVDEAGMSKAKTTQRTAQKVLDWLDAVGVLGYGAQSPTLRRSPLAQPHFLHVAFQSAGWIQR